MERVVRRKKMVSMRCRWLASNAGRWNVRGDVTRGAPRYKSGNNDGFDDEGISQSWDHERATHSRLLGRLRGSKMSGC